MYTGVRISECIPEKSFLRTKESNLLSEVNVLYSTKFRGQKVWHIHQSRYFDKKIPVDDDNKSILLVCT